MLQQKARALSRFNLTRKRFSPRQNADRSTKRTSLRCCTFASLFAMAAAVQPGENIPVQADTRAAYVAHLQDLTQTMAAFAEEADAQTGQFAEAEKRYQAIGAEMQADLARHDPANGTDHDAVTQDQRSALEQAAGQADHIHSGVMAGFSDLKAKSPALVDASSEASTRCQWIEDATQAGVDDLKSACKAFQGAFGPFRQGIRDLQQAFTQSEQVWTDERAKQEDLLRAAQAHSP